VLGRQLDWGAQGAWTSLLVRSLLPAAFQWGWLRRRRGRMVDRTPAVVGRIS
jgi:hypothetical protein